MHSLPQPHWWFSHGFFFGSFSPAAKSCLSHRRCISSADTHRFLIFSPPRYVPQPPPAPHCRLRFGHCLCRSVSKGCPRRPSRSSYRCGAHAESTDVPKSVRVPKWKCDLPSCETPRCRKRKPTRSARTVRSNVSSQSSSFRDTCIEDEKLEHLC